MRTKLKFLRPFSPHGFSICKKHKRITISKKLIRILIIVMIVIIIMMIIITIIIIVIIILLLIIIIIRSNKKSIEETLTWGYRFDDKLERSAVYYFKDEFSVAILVTDSTERKFMKCTIPRLSRFPSFMAPVRAQTSANADGKRKAFYLVPFTLQESIAVGTTTFTLLQERGSSTLIICRKINMATKEGKWTLCY